MGLGLTGKGQKSKVTFYTLYESGFDKDFFDQNFSQVSMSSLSD